MFSQKLQYFIIIQSIKSITFENIFGSKGICFNEHSRGTCLHIVEQAQARRNLDTLPSIAFVLRENGALSCVYFDCKLY